MIQPNEIRIGNWVQTGKELKFQFSIDDWEEDSGTIKDGIYPIPLTPEILEKAEFEYDGITYSMEILLLSKGVDVWDVWLHGLAAGITTKIKYVHQLQNLYFALTGEELKIEL